MPEQPLFPYWPSSLLLHSVGTNLQFKRALVRAMDKESCTELKVKELQHMLDMLTSLPGTSEALAAHPELAARSAAGSTMVADSMGEGDGEFSLTGLVRLGSEAMKSIPNEVILARWDARQRASEAGERASEAGQRASEAGQEGQDGEGKGEEAAATAGDTVGLKEREETGVNSTGVDADTGAAAGELEGVLDAKEAEGAEVKGGEGGDGREAAAESGGDADLGCEEEGEAKSRQPEQTATKELAATEAAAQSEEEEADMQSQQEVKEGARATAAGGMVQGEDEQASTAADAAAIAPVAAKVSEPAAGAGAQGLGEGGEVVSSHKAVVPHAVDVDSGEEEEQEDGGEAVDAAIGDVASDVKEGGDAGTKA